MMGDVDANTMKTLLEILSKSSLPAPKIEALEFLLGLTASPEGMKTIYDYANVIFCTVIKNLFDENLDVARKAGSILINVSAEKRGAESLLSSDVTDTNVAHNICKTDQRNNLLSNLLEIVLFKNNAIAESGCIILSNLSRSANLARKMYECFENPNDALYTLISRAARTDAPVDHLSSFLSNLSQLEEVRTYFLNATDDSMYKLLSLIDFKDSVIRRQGAVGIIRNLSFYNGNHEKLLDAESDLLAKILLPLAGPEEFDDEDNEKLPLDLQYLPADKVREPNKDLRKMLVEIFMQLAATASGRKIMRDNNVYVIFREYHKWETDTECLQLIEDFVNILIRTEEEIGVDNLRDEELLDRKNEEERSNVVYV